MEALGEPGRPRRGVWLIAIVVGVTMLLLVVVLITRKSAADRADFDPLENKVAPAIVGTTLDGKPFDLDGLRGEWVVVNFFATWCVPCQQEHPDLVSFSQRHADAKDVQLISVVFNDECATELTSAMRTGEPVIVTAPSMRPRPMSHQKDVMNG